MTRATTRLAFIAVLAAAGAIALGLIARVHPGPFVLDEPLGHALQRLPSGFGTFASLPGDWRIVVPAALLVAGLAWRLGDGAVAIAVVAAEGARSLNPAWKALVERPRPGPDALAVHDVAGGWSYPSGHASTAALVFGLLALLALRRLRGRARLTVGCTAFAAIALTGAGRVIVGAHWPSDVLGGWLAGGATAACLIILAELLWGRQRRRD